MKTRPRRLHDPDASRGSQRLALFIILTVVAYSSSFSAGFALDSKGLIPQDARVHAVTRETVDLIVQHTYWWPIDLRDITRSIWRYTSSMCCWSMDCHDDL